MSISYIPISRKVSFMKVVSLCFQKLPALLEYSLEVITVHRTVTINTIPGKGVFN
jgi:hypothetical protein